MTLKAQIQEDIKQAMKAREQAKLSTLRMLSAAIKQREVDERIELDDAAIIAIIEKQIKQRNEAALQFEQGGRSESALAEKAEVAVLSQYLPAQLTEAEVLAIVRSAVAELSATGHQDMGKVMGKVKPVLAGQADMGKVSALIKQVLSSL